MVGIEELERLGSAWIALRMEEREATDAYQAAFAALQDSQRALNVAISNHHDVVHRKIEAKAAFVSAFFDIEMDEAVAL